MLFQNKLKVFHHLNELNGWSAWRTQAHSFFPLWLQPSDIVAYTTPLNILKQDDHWESSKSQYSCMRGSDIALWFALLASTDIAFSEKFVISSLLS